MVRVLLMDHVGTPLIQNIFREDQAQVQAAVALGLSTFSLGTDTAGSGRVPAGFNNLIGLKPTIGLLSSTGMLPACRSLDCMSIFAFTCDDAAAVLTIAEGVDDSDAYSRKNPFSNSHAFYGKRTGKLVIRFAR